MLRTGPEQLRNNDVTNVNVELNRISLSLFLSHDAIRMREWLEKKRNLTCQS